MRGGRRPRARRSNGRATPGNAADLEEDATRDDASGCGLSIRRMRIACERGAGASAPLAAKERRGDYHDEQGHGQWDRRRRARRAFAGARSDAAGIRHRGNRGAARRRSRPHFPAGADFAQGAGPEVTKAELGYIALTDARRSSSPRRRASSPSTACPTSKSSSRRPGARRATTWARRRGKRHRRRAYPDADAVPHHHRQGDAEQRPDADVHSVRLNSTARRSRSRKNTRTSSRHSTPRRSRRPSRRRAPRARRSRSP